MLTVDGCAAGADAGAAAGLIDPVPRRRADVRECGGVPSDGRREGGEVVRAPIAEIHQERDRQIGAGRGAGPARPRDRWLPWIGPRR